MYSVYFTNAQLVNECDKPHCGLQEVQITVPGYEIDLVIDWTRNEVEELRVFEVGMGRYLLSSLRAPSCQSLNSAIYVEQGRILCPNTDHDSDLFAEIVGSAGIVFCFEQQDIAEELIRVGGHEVVLADNGESRILSAKAVARLVTPEGAQFSYVKSQFVWSFG